MKIILTGATGFLGFRTLEKLVEDPRIETILACGRTIKPTHQVKHPKVRYLLGDLSDYKFINSIKNKADAIILSLFAEEQALNQTYNITNGEPCFLWDKIGFILKHLEYDKPLKKAPYFLVKILADAEELKARIFKNKEPALTIYAAGILAKSFTLDITKAKELLKYTPQVSTDEALLEYIRNIK